MRILIVDDNDPLREILVRILSVRHDCIQAANGAQAIAAMSRNRGRLDAMFLDLVLPDLEAPELIEIAEIYCPGARKIAITGLSKSSIPRGFDRVVLKPFSIEDVCSALEDS